MIVYSVIEALRYRAATEPCPCGAGRAYPLRINGLPRAGCPMCGYTGRLPGYPQTRVSGHAQ